ncbi:MAG: MFS transporter, partial [Chitinispirillaceae bacterium]|nr:MFS transporter [Chitinispirillaceae bacterium]
MGNSFVEMIEKNKIAVLIVSLIASFLTPFMVASINVAIPKIGDELKIGAVYLGLIPSSYLLCSVIFLIPFGKLGDIYGRKKIFYYGIIVITLSSIAAALSFHWLILLFSRALHGIGASMIFGTGMAMLTSTFPLQKRGMVLGINVSSTYLGLMLGPVIGGFITHYWGWRILFGVIVPIGIIVLFIVKFFVEEDCEITSSTRLDKRDVLLYGLTIFLLIIGISNMTKNYGILSIMMGIITLTFFWKREKNISEPIFPINLFIKNRIFAFSNLAAFVNYSATYGIGFIMTLYLQKVRGLTPDKAGFIMIVQPVIMALLSP